MSTSSYLIGVDTGGTYTDAAVIEAQSHRVLARAKAITTKGDLAIGVTEAINAAVAQLPQGLLPQRVGHLDAPHPAVSGSHPPGGAQTPSAPAPNGVQPLRAPETRTRRIP